MRLYLVLVLVPQLTPVLEILKIQVVAWMVNAFALLILADEQKPTILLYFSQVVDRAPIQLEHVTV